ncbi:MAG: HAMP domain-containing histidine kinase [Myxococcota bacterium]|nr:HAMP domain-containing histidine kinase [Myxococcota bacterium]
MSRAAPTRGRGLLLRVYVFGVLMSALATGASFLVGTYLFQPVAEGPSRPSTAWIAWHLIDIADDRASLRRELEDLKSRSNIEMTIFDARGKLIDSNAEWLPEPLGAAELARFATERTSFQDGAGVVVETGLDGRVTRYARVRYPLAALPLGLGALQLAAALGVLALISIPVARSLARPVEDLAALTRAFGSGDLSRRSNSDRRDEIGDLERAFDEMADRIGTLRRSEKELLANVSHELRTPLARIRLALELVRDGAERAESYFTDIEDDLAELEQLLDGILTAARLDLARGDGGDTLPPLKREPVEGRKLIGAAEARFRIRHPERKLSTSLPDSLPNVSADLAMLRRVLDNLLDNAVKFSEPEDIIELEGASDSAGALVLRVRDCGMGIATEDLARIFEPFFRGDRSRTRSTGGVGLGLAIAKRIVEAHGGNIAVESDPSRGTCFTVSIPTSPASSASG